MGQALIYMNLQNNILSKYIKFAPLLIGLVTVFITIFPLFHAEFFHVHDFTQAARIIEMYRGLQDGQIPVRWSQNFGYGYGMPTFLFYGPLPYIVGAGFYWLTQNVLFSLKMIWAIPSVLSFVGMYSWTKKYFGRVGGVVAAVAFTLAPYRAVDLYVRGAIGEVWAIAYFPWLLLAVDQWFEKPRWISAQLILWIGALLITHNLMAMFFLPVIVMYGGLCWLFQSKKTFLQIMQFFFQLALGLGIAAFFIFPALLEKDLTQINERILGGYFNYTQHFVYIRQFFQENWKYGGSAWGPNDDLSFFLGYAQIFALFMFGATIIWNKKGRVWQIPAPIAPVVLLAGMLFPISLFMCTHKSGQIWALSTFLQTAQFPWRFLSLSIFFLAILVGAIFAFVPTGRARIILSIFLVLSLMLPSLKYFKSDGFLDNAESVYYTDPHRIRFEMSSIWPDFLPKHLGEKITPTDTRFELLDGGVVQKDQVLIDRSHQLLIQINSTKAETIILHIANFPGWKVYADGKPIEFTETTNGLIQVTVPAGVRQVGAQLERTPTRLIADMVTVLSLIVLFIPQIRFSKLKYTQSYE